MSHRFFVDTPIDADRARLTGAEAHHLLHVMRAKLGDEVMLFDGSGREFAARVDRLGRADVQLAVISARAVSREAAGKMVIGVALPKGDRQRWLIEKLTELGVSQVVPLRTERSQVHPDERARRKLRRFVIEASKQCRRNRLMEIGPTAPFSAFLETAPRHALRWLADPSGHPTAATPPPHEGTCVAIGPEGGFVADELRAAREAGWHIVSLGPRILRIETAGIVLATLASSDLQGGGGAAGDDPSEGGPPR